MKTIINYQCEVCHAIYDTEQGALTCENQIESYKTSSVKVGDTIKFVREIKAVGGEMTTFIDSEGKVLRTFIKRYKEGQSPAHTRIFIVEVAEDKVHNLIPCVRVVVMEFGTTEGDKFFSPGMPGYEFTIEQLPELLKLF